MNAAANVGWSNDPRGARHWAHIFAPQTSHEGGTVKGRPSLTPKEPAPVLDATAYSLSAIVSKVDDKLVPMLVTAESRSRSARRSALFDRGDAALVIPQFTQCMH